MSEQSRAIEQLWYTWSDVGLDTIRAGFRIRAASAGLQDIHSVRVQNLDRYQRYSLPQDVDLFSATPDTAPICLSLIATGQERILVHKAYTGKDGVGRYGAFFIHLLFGLPEDFSVLHAISLWKSPFWQVSDASLKDRQSTSLDRVSLENLKGMGKDIPSSRRGTRKIRACLPYIIQAYLTKKPLVDRKTLQTVPQKLYIAASDDDVAVLISGLAHCLPAQLLKNLTFSTYAHDVTEATTEIVGTCWLSVPELEKNRPVARLLPEQYYREKLAINCYTGKCSPLENNPLVENKSLAAQFAQDATEYFVRGGAKEFEGLLEKARCYANLDVDKLLSLYERCMLRVQNPPKQNIEFVLTPQSYSEYETALLPACDITQSASGGICQRQAGPSWLERIVARVQIKKAKQRILRWFKKPQEEF
jgi:hypothetical protein